MSILITISSFLGWLLIAACAVMKVPQITNILKAKSGEGVSLSSFTIEIFLYAISFCYCFQSEYPLSTYIENCLLMIQNIIIILLTLYYAKRIFDKKVIIISLIFVGFHFFLLIPYCPAVLLGFLQSCTTPMFLICKIPQIYQNWKMKDTGSLSLLMNIGLMCGNLIRVFTSFVEIGNDWMLISGFFVNALLNLVIILQIIFYEKKEEKEHNE